MWNDCSVGEFILDNLSLFIFVEFVECVCVYFV